MLSPILVPLDGSSVAGLALPLATRLASAHGAALHLVTAIDDSRGEEHARRRVAQEYLTSIAARLGTGSVGRVTTALADSAGSIADAIAEEAARVGARLVVLTTHGRGSFSRLWLGSVTAALLDASTVPLLVVRRDDPRIATPALPRRLLVGVDGSTEAEEALEIALEVTQPFRACCTLLRVVRTGDSLLPYDETFWTPGEASAAAARRSAAEDEVAALVSRLRARGVAARGLVVLGSDPVRVLLRTAADQGAELVALGTHPHTAAARLLGGGVTDELLRAATLPVLVARPVSTAARSAPELVWTPYSNRGNAQ